MIAAVIIIAILILILVISYLAYRRAFYSPMSRHGEEPELPLGEQYERYAAHMRLFIESVEKRPFELVEIKARDGISLGARYYHVKDGAPLQIMFPGYKGSALRDLCGGCELALDTGFNVLLVDQRAHGRSGGVTITFGIKERYDCLSWIDYAVERFGKDVEIVLSGISMGAATVIMAAALDIPKNVKAVAADCPFSSPKEIISSVIRKMKLPVAAAYPFVALGARLFGGFGLEEGDPLSAAKKVQVPVLIIHGEDDRLVPCDMSRKIQAANPNLIRLETFPGAGHGLSFVSDNDRYQWATKSFFEDVGIKTEY